MDTEKSTLTRKGVVIAEVFKELISDQLSYVDLTIECPNPGDLFSKRNVLKRQFEKKIYDLRNLLFALNGTQALKLLSQELDRLRDTLKDMASAAVDHDVCRNAFLSLINTSLDKVKIRIEDEIAKNPDIFKE